MQVVQLYGRAGHRARTTVGGGDSTGLSAGAGVRQGETAGVLDNGRMRFVRRCRFGDVGGQQGAE